MVEWMNKTTDIYKNISRIVTKISSPQIHMHSLPKPSANILSLTEFRVKIII